MSGFFPIGGIKGKLVTASYDLTTASGSQNITGAGFTPVGAIIICNKDNNSAFSVGLVDNAGGNRAIFMVSDSTVWFGSTGAAIEYSNGALSASQVGAVALAADGVSITWTKTGAPSGTLNIYAYFLR